MFIILFFRVLGYRRTPPVAGRFVNLIKFEKVANKKLRKTFFTSPSKCIIIIKIYYKFHVSVNK